MDRYLDLACEIEVIVDNAVNRCFQFGDNTRLIRRTLDHAFYLRNELQNHKESLKRSGPPAHGIEYNVQQAYEVYHEYCVLLEDVSTSRSPELLLKRLQPDISDYRSRLDVCHAALTQAIDEFEHRQRPRPLMPLPPLSPSGPLGSYEQPGYPTVVVNSNATGRRRPQLFQNHTYNGRPTAGPSRTVLFDDHWEPSQPSYQYGTGRPTREYIVTERHYEHGFAPRAAPDPEWIDDERPSGFRHVRGTGW